MAVNALVLTVALLFRSSRALGDRFLQPYVCSQPDLFLLEDWSQHNVLILACDGTAVRRADCWFMLLLVLAGVWDVVDDREAVAIAVSTSDACKAAKRLRNRALQRGSADNISVGTQRRLHWGRSLGLTGVALVIVRLDVAAPFVQRMMTMR